MRIARSNDGYKAAVSVIKLMRKPRATLPHIIGCSTNPEFPKRIFNNLQRKMN